MILFVDEVHFTPVFKNALFEKMKNLSYVLAIGKVADERNAKASCCQINFRFTKAYKL